MEGPLCASSGAAVGPSSSFNQSRELGSATPGSGAVGGDKRSVLLSPAALGEEALGAEGGWGLACSAVRTQGTFRGG